VSLVVRPAAARGRTQTDWLDSRHTFSFGEYHDPAHMGFGALRVINDDRVAPGKGFATHGHRDMEIVTYVLEGALEHKDSLGTGSVIRPGEVQIMSAGTGIQHSEFNHSPVEPVHLLQIWIVPDRRGLPPRDDQRAFDPAELAGKLRRVVSPDGDGGAIVIHQDASMHAARLAPADVVQHALAPGREAWLQVARGAVTANGAPLGPGDGAAVTGERTITVRATEAAEILLFDLA
jgi:redox-sensitive bicupin YhaK (pirin superfamily)